MNTYNGKSIDKIRNDVKISGAIRGERVYKINTQSDLEKLLGDSYGAYKFDGDVSNPVATANGGSACKIPPNTIIIINPIQGTLGNSLSAGGAGIGDDGTNTFNGRPAYVLKNAIELSDNVVIIGFNQEDTIIIKDDSSANQDDIKFYNTYKNQETITDVDGNTTFTSADGTQYKEGDILHWSQDNTFYTVINIATNVITLDKALTAGTAKEISILTTGVSMEGWSFDGRGGVNGLGGTIIGVSKNGGAFNIPYLGNSILNLKIVNHKISSTSTQNLYGGGIYGAGSVYNIIAKNIEDCQISVGSGGTGSYGGGGVSGCHYSNMEAIRTSVNMFDGIGNHLGGGFYNCNHSKLKATDCYAYCFDMDANGGGGGMAYCNYSDILAIRCTENYSLLNGYEAGGGGAYYCNYSTITAINCTAIGDGGGVHSCDYSTIRIESGIASVDGGGAYSCNKSKITVNNCSATTGNGGGVHSCNHCEISVKGSSSATGDGGGAYDCDYSEIKAVLCLATSGNGGGVHSCNFCEKIEAIECDAQLGGGAYDCNYSKIRATACDGADGGGAHSCDYSDLDLQSCTISGLQSGGGGYGGGAYDCDYCNIVAKNCLTDLKSGGGVSKCDFCVIVAINCTAYEYGGGVDDSNYCTVTCINCTASSFNGGGAIACDYMICVGNWYGNTAPLGSNPNIQTNGLNYKGIFATGTVDRNYTSFVTTPNF